MVASTVVLSLVVWVLRRPDQLLRPYVWVEKYLIINRTITEGFWSAAVGEYVGYLMVPTSLIVAAVTVIDLRSLPELAYLAATIVFILTILLIVVPSSRVPLRARCLLALLLALAPMNPEMFGIALYSYWWTALWPAITLLWDRNAWALRLPVLVLGGLSGLAGAALVVPHALASLMRRRTSDRVSTAVLGGLFVLQGAIYAGSARRSTIPVQPLSIARQFVRNFGSYAFGWVQGATPEFIEFAGLVVAVFIGAAVVRQLLQRSACGEELVLFAASLGVLGLLSSSAAPLITHQVLAGPRYYFYPFVLTAWSLLLVAAGADHLAVRRTAFSLLVASALTLAPAFSRTHVPRSWDDELRRCAQSDDDVVSIPVHFDGTETMWDDAVRLPSSRCRELVASTD